MLDTNNIRTSETFANRLVQVPIRDRAIGAFPYLVTILFFCLSLWGILHHEMWRDELQAWLVARDSQSLLDVIHNVRYERSPALWQICLRLLTYFTSNPIAMQLFHLCVATTSIFLFVKYSPFTKIQRAMFAFGYFAFYEYALISRSYSLGMLLIIVLCILLTRSALNYLLIALTIAVLANTNVYGLLLAPAFAVYVLAELIVQYRSTRAIAQKKLLLVACLLLAAGMAASVFQLKPPANYTLQSQVPVIKEVDKDSFAGSFTPIFSSYVAIPNLFGSPRWGSNILDAAPVLFARRLSVLTSLLLFASAVLLFLRRPTVLLAYVSGTGVLLWFSATIYSGEIRHKGHLFLFFIACFWLLSASRSPGIFESRFSSLDRLLRRSQTVFLTLILFAQLVGGAVATATDLRNPFSETKQAAEFVRERLTPTTVLAGTSFMVSPMTAYLDVKCYMVDRQTFGTFMLWDNKLIWFSSDEKMLQSLAKLLDGQTREVLYVTNLRINPLAAGLEVNELAEFTRSFNGDKFYVYRVRRQLMVSPHNSH